jgi:hypothetical protein
MKKWIPSLTLACCIISPLSSYAVDIHCDCVPTQPTTIVPFTKICSCNASAQPFTIEKAASSIDVHFICAHGRAVKDHRGWDYDSSSWIGCSSAYRDSDVSCINFNIFKGGWIVKFKKVSCGTGKL